MEKELDWKKKQKAKKSTSGAERPLHGYSFAPIVVDKRHIKNPKRIRGWREHAAVPFRFPLHAVSSLVVHP